jgi:hypothetical protein
MLAFPHAKLLDQVRDRLRLKRCSIRKEPLYVQGIRRFILFHDMRHAGEMGAAEVEAFLTDQAAAPSTPRRSIPY